ncbi:IncA domain protein [Rhizoctonia solani AG-3 Rhs1AP]|uniref:IncA domain protein n=1 Tax=Rhizoctonia solani AG-3 Rhs1AP TaxID=1086054 RepID=X8JKK6_9AGAM|nr:IncA domain protein [Rhizoctonia solani AG-3 Rhs1AP]
MSSTFLCHCNRIAAPAVIEGNTMLVCRHLLQGSQYRTDPHHIPCGFKSEDTAPEFQPTVRAAVLYRRPKAFQALALPPGSDSLDLYRSKNEIATSNSRAQVAEDAMEIDEAPSEGAWIVHPEQRPSMDLHALQKRCLMLERQLQASEEDRRQLKQQMVNLQEETQQSTRALEEQSRVRVRAKEEEAEYYRKKYESVRTELHGLRRSTRNIVSNALQPHRTSSPSPI